MADSNYYVDKNGDVWTSILRNGDQIVSAIRVNPVSGEAGDVPSIFIGDPGLSPIPATGKDGYFAWKQSEGAKYFKTPTQTSISTPANSSYGVLPPAQTGLNNPLIAPQASYATSANINQLDLAQDAAVNAPVTIVTPIPGQSYKSVTTGPSAVSIAIPGVETPPVMAPTRATEFNPTSGGINVGTGSQVRLAENGDLYITPGPSTSAQLGTGVQQAANGDYIATDGGIVVLPPNTEILMEPGSAITAAPFAAGNTQTTTFVTPALNNQFAEPVVPQNSAGAEVIESQQAYDENATPTNPVPEAEVIGNPKLSTAETQPTVQDSSQYRGEPGEDGTTSGFDGVGGRFGTGPGLDPIGPVAQKNKEDPLGSEAQPSPATSARSATGSIFYEKIIPRENAFKKFATMTYSVSVYAMTAARYAEMVSTGVKSVNGMTLLIQSAGANSSSGNSQQNTGNYGARRSPHFNLDFYIDDIEFNGIVSGTSAQAAHNIFDLKFKIIEPNGLSFLNRLHASIKDYMLSEGASASNINYAAAMFLMVVRFYGYDEYGNILDGNTIGKQETTSDTKSVTEKFIPFKFTGISFSVVNDVIQYNCEAVCPQSFWPLNDTHSRIPFNMEITGGTVKEVLAGEATASTTATNTVFTGLTAALNKEQIKLQNSGIIDYPCVYKIEFEPGSGISDALTRKPGSVTKEKTAMPTATSNPSTQLDGNKNVVDKDNKSYSIPAGTSIIQAIETVLKNSTYLSSQQNVIIDEVTGKAKINPEKKNQISSTTGENEAFVWYKIRSEVKPTNYDNKTNNYAYEIRYLISTYRVNDVQSRYFPPSLFLGAHKEYDYWFTGKNTEVLDFKQDFNYLYFQQFGPEPNVGIDLPVTNTIHVANKFYMPRSNQSAVGSSGSRSNEPVAYAADLLYSPADTAQIELTILGDPDWMAQSEVFYSPSVSVRDVGVSPFMKDGSINYDSSEVVFNVRYKTPSDYAQNGLMDIDQKDTTSIENYGSGTVSLNYRANEIKTILSRGEFKQVLKGTLLQYYDTEAAYKGTLDGREGVFYNPRRKSQIEAANVTGSQSTISDISAGLGGGRITESDINAPRKAYTPEELGVQQIDDELADFFDGDETAAAEYYVGEDDVRFLADQPIAQDPSPEVANVSTQPKTSNDTEYTPSQGTQTIPPTEADIPIERANTDFQLPPKINTGTGWTEPETIPTSSLPEGVTLTDTDEEGQQYFTYKGQEIGASSKNALDKQIKAIDQGIYEPYEDYVALYGTRVRYTWRPDLKQYEETEYYDNDTGKWAKFKPL